MEFIESTKKDSSSCVFCELAAPGDDKERLILHRDSTCYIVMNRYPYNNGHLLIIPYQHTSSLSSLSLDESQQLIKCCALAMDVLKHTLHAEGFNCGFNFGSTAGAGIEDHLHMHVVPRWNGDHNFMPVISETRSIPEYLSETYDRLIPHFHA